MSLTIKDKRPVVITNGPSTIPSAAAVANALGISSDDVILTPSIGGAVYSAFAYLPYEWVVTSSFDGDSGILLRTGDTITPEVGTRIPTSCINRIQFYGTIS